MKPSIVTTATLVAATLLVSLPAEAQLSPQFAKDFRMEPCTFANTGGENPFYIITPGYWLKLEGYEGPNFVEVLITVTAVTKDITFTTPRGAVMTVSARELEEREWINSELVEVSRNWFARCVQTNDMYYFGERVDIYQNGQIVSHEGSWRAGVFGAWPGVIMPGTMMPGSRYYQEIAGHIAQDRAEHLVTGISVSVPYGTLDRCVRIVETTPLEPGEESFKTYCEGIGLVQDADVELVSRGLPLPVAP